MALKNDLPSEDRFILEQTKSHSRTYAFRFWELLQTHTGKNNLPANVKTPAAPAVRKKIHPLFLVLKLFPWLLCAGFGASFFWDFPSQTVYLWTLELRLEGLLRTLSVSGLIGYLTNWIAITMLFRPVYKRPLLGQGLIPAQKIKIAERLADSVSNELINAEVIRRKLEDQKLISVYRERFVDYTRQVLQDPAFRDDLKKLLVNYVDDLLGDQAVREIIARKTFEFIEKSVEDKGLEKFAFKTYKLLRGEEAHRIIERSIAELPSKLEANLQNIEQVLNYIPDAVEENSQILENWAVSAIVSLINSLDIRTIVVDNLYQYDEQRFEKLIKGSTNEQLQYIQYLGAILGVIGGLVIWQPLLALGFLVVTGLVIWLLDTLLFRLTKKTAA